MFTIQNFVFDFSSLPEHMFYQTSGEDYICHPKGKGISLETFLNVEAKIEFLSVFNSFPAEHFLLNTKAKDVYLKLNLNGKISDLKVMKKTLWDNEIAYQSNEQEINGEIILGPFPLENGTKRYSVELSTRDKFEILSAEWCVDKSIVKEKTVDLSITTFKKEKYIINNINSVLSYPPLDKFKFRTIVVDNGNTLLEDNFEFSEKLLLISQANLGGTGGFMRGLMEAHKNDTDYILFMDDDILLSPEIVFRALAIAQISQDKKAYGGMMFHYTKKDKIHEQGGRLPWEINRFFTAINDGDYLKNLNNPQYDALYSEGNPDFSGWWFYMAEVKETPILPNFFFKWDDICSSLYLQKNGVKLSVFPTLFVWHEDFSIKRHLFMTDYLSMRNEIYAFAFLGVSKKQMEISFKRTFQLVVRDILMWDYSRAEIRIKALQDSLKYKEILSPEFVLSGNGDYPVKLGREYTPEMQYITSDIDPYFEKERPQMSRGKKKYIKLMFRLLRLILPWKREVLKNNKLPMLSMHNGNFTILYGYKKYFLYNADGHIGYYCEYSLSKTLRLLKDLIKTIKNVKKEYPEIVGYMKVNKFDENYWNIIFKAK
ncbi:glycosyltransferase family 2 protein [Aggregatibacter actinomycetemcomitans]|nr:glycosyltransferase family 2 protein [Aggregatibacter actinomycetemcomitans]